MNRIERALRNIAGVLETQGEAFALVGGFAVSARSEPRFTRDVDFAVATTGDPQAEQLVHRLTGEGYTVLATVEQEATGRLATVRLRPPGLNVKGVVTDLLFASSGIEPEVVAGADIIEIVAGLRVPVAATGHLIALKVLAEGPERPQDASDLRALLAVATPLDLDVARAGLDLIQKRGFNRNKDLPGEFSRWLGGR
jgi:hypothetical protein